MKEMCRLLYHSFYIQGRKGWYFHVKIIAFTAISKDNKTQLCKVKFQILP